MVRSWSVQNSYKCNSFRPFYQLNTKNCWPTCFVLTQIDIKGFAKRYTIALFYFVWFESAALSIHMRPCEANRKKFQSLKITFRCVSNVHQRRFVWVRVSWPILLTSATSHFTRYNKISPNRLVGWRTVSGRSISRVLSYVHKSAHRVGLNYILV
jgi:hypothetical protein